MCVCHPVVRKGTKSFLTVGMLPKSHQPNFSPMNVLIGCEYSGVVRSAFRKLGHDAWSCDLLPSDDQSEFHYQGDVLEAINRRPWDLAIFHPPCTHLAVSGACWFKHKQKEQEQALDFVRLLLDAPIPRIALENPVSIISSRIRKPSQIIQPYEFGHDASKRTCLWLKNLPLLKPTQYVEPKITTYKGKEVKRWANQTPQGSNKLGPSENRWKLRSTTFQGIADAMASQWGCI